MNTNRTFMTPLSKDEMSDINGGFFATIMAAGAIAAACVAIYEAGKYTGEIAAELMK